MWIRSGSRVRGSLLLVGVTISYACASSTATQSDGGGADGSVSDAGRDARAASEGDANRASTGDASTSDASRVSSGDASASDASRVSRSDASGGEGGTLGGASVLQHHFSSSRDGVYTDALMTKSAGATMKLTAAFAPAINGDIYAQPLYVTDGPRGSEAFIIATETNHLTAIDGSGSILWDQTYGMPVTRNQLPCGDIAPLGITGTPIIDAASRTIYFDAMTSLAGAPTHVIHAVSVDTGADQPGWPAGGLNVDMYVAGFTSVTENQRGALALLNGVLYVPYGGHFGDCGTYFGYVIGIPVANPTAITPFSVGAMFPTGSAAATGASKGGIWAVGGIASDGTSLFVSTGNTSGNSTVWSGGEAVLRLAPGPAFTSGPANQFYPGNWAMLDASDEDLGAANPIVFDMANPTGGTQRLLAAPGKDGFLYVLSRDNLGGMGGQLSMTAVAPQGTGGAGALSAAGAAYTTSTGTYVAYRINVGPGKGCPTGGASSAIGVARISGSPPTANVVWCTTEVGLGSPIVTTTGTGDVILWDANTRLYGYDGDTGTRVFAGGGATDAMASPIHYYNSPIDVGGRIVIATHQPGHVYMFKP